MFQVLVPFLRAIGISRSFVWDVGSTIGEVFGEILGGEGELPWSSLRSADWFCCSIGGFSKLSNGLLLKYTRKSGLSINQVVSPHVLGFFCRPLASKIGFRRVFKVSRK